MTREQDTVQETDPTTAQNPDQNQDQDPTQNKEQDKGPNAAGGLRAGAAHTTGTAETEATTGAATTTATAGGTVRRASGALALLPPVLFCCALALALVTHVSVLWALAFGYVVFFLQGLKAGATSHALLRASGRGIRAVAPILLVFACIGLLTATWRSCGTIAYLVDAALPLVSPSALLPLVFLLNAGLSFLLGSSFATSATMGVLTFSLGTALGCPAWLTGGAVLAGVYFGDRGSPMSTSAHLVRLVTGTDIYTNVRAMWRTALPAFVLALLVSLAISVVLAHTGGLGATSPADAPSALSPSASLSSPPSSAAGTVSSSVLFRLEYHLSPLLALPAVVALVLALCRVRVPFVMLAGTLVAVALDMALQGRALSTLPDLLLWGFTAKNAQVAALMDGGGLFSFATVGGIVCLSSTYAGLFHEGGTLRPLEDHIRTLAAKYGDYAPFAAAATLVSLLACNQTLPILLTRELTSEMDLPGTDRAVNIADSAVVIPALIPWSVACATPLDIMGAPTHSVFAAFFLWFLILSRLAGHRRRAASA